MMTGPLQDRRKRRVGYPPSLWIYVGVLLALCAPPFVTGLGLARGRLLETLLWIGFLAVANLLAIPMVPRADVTAHLGAPVAVASAIVLPPPLVMVVNLVGFTAEQEFRRGTSPWAILFNRAQIALSAYAGALLADAMPQLNSVTLAALLTTAAAALAYNVVNSFALTVWLYLRGHLDLSAAARSMSNPFPRFASDFGLVALLAVVIVIGYESVGVLAVLLIGFPLYLGYSALRSARVAEDRAEQLSARVRELETLNDLGTELLTVRTDDQVMESAVTALRAVLDTHDVEFSLSGVLDEHLQVVKVPGAEPAAAGIPAGVPEGELAVVEAVARLAGMALQRLELEGEVAEGQRARARLSGQILEEGTRERNRIALEIHDEVLPYLAAAEIQADNVSSAMASGQPEHADRLLRATRDAVSGGTAQLREVLEALRRQIVVPGGLRDSLAETLKELRLTTGLESRLAAPDPMPPLPLAVEILALELVKGCLTNVTRHAQAGSIDVWLQVANDVLTVLVRDDGVGFDPTAVPEGHHGLTLMAQRIELARGRFTVDSAVGAGTTVVVEVPL